MSRRVCGKYTVEKHSDMDNWEEFLAKFILEDSDICGLAGLVKHESPDWLSDSLGVEVVKAYDPVFNEVNGLYERDCIDVLNGAYKQDKRSVYRRYSLRGDTDMELMVESRILRGDEFTLKVEIASGDLYSTRKPLLLKALESKLERLNSGHYYLIDTWLFIFSLIDLKGDSCSVSRHNKPGDLLHTLSVHQCSILSRNKTWRGFSVICVYSIPDHVLCKLDICNNTVEIFDVNESKYSDSLSSLSRKR